LNNNKDIYLRKVFKEDLEALLKLLITDRYSIILYLNSNEDMKTGSLARYFRLLGLTNLIKLVTPTALSASYINSSR